MKTVNGHYVGVSAPRDGAGWGRKSILIGYVWTSKKMKDLVTSGVWDAETGEFILYAQPDDQQYNLVLDK